jgi:glutamate-1-semialdehyde 2,1-aminomutase
MMETFEFAKSRQLFGRAERVIPTGLPGHLSPAWYDSPEMYPNFAIDGNGARFTDVDGNEYVDYMCAFGPMMLGYSHPKVTEAAIAQMRKSTVLSNATPNVVELAEALTDLVTIADWAFFCKNGADVTELATTVARAATGRKKIVLINGGYHGTAPWMLDPETPGVLSDDVANVIYIDWNDIEGFEKVVADNDGEIAGFMAAPYFQPLWASDELPAEGYWKAIEGICRKEGIALIVDDVRCGFRLDLRGSNEYFGFKPDLICLSKAIANGHPLSALVGTDAMKDAAGSLVAVGTFWYEATAFAASLVTLAELQAIDAARTVIATGEKWTQLMAAAAASNGYELEVTGVPSMASFRIVGDDAERMPLTAEWGAECTRRGAFMAPFHNGFVSTAHTEEDLNLTGEIAAEAFAAIRKRQG